MADSTQHAAIGAAVAEFLARVLADIDDYTTRRDAAIAEVEARGYRIVGGGQTLSGWEVTDWRNGDVIAAGSNDDDYEQAVDRVDPDHRWWHIDAIDTDLDNPVSLGPIGTPLPGSLAEPLRSWAESNEDEARALVALCRADLSVSPSTERD